MGGPFGQARMVQHLLARGATPTAKALRGRVARGESPGRPDWFRKRERATFVDGFLALVYFVWLCTQGNC